MHEKSNHEALKNEIERGHFAKAVIVAEHTGLPEEEIRNLHFKAFGQMCAIYRNVHGAKNLARQYGFSKEAVKQFLEQFVDDMKNEGNTKPLEPCYDYSTGKYLSFEEWMDHYLKIWDRLSV